MNAVVENKTGKTEPRVYNGPDQVLVFVEKKYRDLAQRREAAIIGVKTAKQGLRITFTDFDNKATRDFTLDGRSGEYESLDGALIQLKIDAKNPPVVRSAAKAPRIISTTPVADKLRGLVPEQYRTLIDAGDLIINSVVEKTVGVVIKIADKAGTADATIRLDGPGGELDRVKEAISNVQGNAKSAAKEAARKAGNFLVPEKLRRLAKRAGVEFVGDAEQMTGTMQRIIIKAFGPQTDTLNFVFDAKTIENDHAKRAEFWRYARQVAASSRKVDAVTAPKRYIAARLSDIPQIYHREAERIGVAFEDNLTRTPEGHIKASITDGGTTAIGEKNNASFAGGYRKQLFVFNGKPGQFERFQVKARDVLSRARAARQASFDLAEQNPAMGKGQEKEKPPAQPLAKSDAAEILPVVYRPGDKDRMRVTLNWEFDGTQASIDGFMAKVHEVVTGEEDRITSRNAALLAADKLPEAAAPLAPASSGQTPVDETNLSWHFKVLARRIGVTMSVSSEEQRKLRARIKEAAHDSDKKPSRVPGNINVSEGPGITVVAGVGKDKQSYQFAEGGLYNRPFGYDENKPNSVNLRAFRIMAQTIVADATARREETASMAVRSRERVRGMTIVPTPTETQTRKPHRRVKPLVVSEAARAAAA